MKTQAIRPAAIRFDDGVPFSPEFGDVYHPASGALAQARHVFLDGNGLPQRWHGRDRFVVLETGFGLGNNFLATWDAWRRDAQACRQLHFISIEQHPLTREALRLLPREPALAPLADELAAAWPPLTPNLHRLGFEGGRVQLLLAFGDAERWLPELVARVDAFYLDGFAPAKNPRMWQPRLFKALARLADVGATAATWTAARPVRDGLAAAGFEVRLAPGQGGKRDNIVARFAPAFVPRRPPSRRSAVGGDEQHALIIGAGLAGCAAAWALAEQGWRSTLLERHASPAQEASGNPAGLFHGTVNPQDGAHARFNRAAALEAQRVIGRVLSEQGVAGRVDGLLRLETSGSDAIAMQQVLHRLGLPPDYVRAVDAGEASALAGIALRHPAWFYPGGGWVSPAGLAAGWLRMAGDRAHFCGGVHVQALRRVGDRWQALDNDGAVIASAPAVVLAHSDGAARLLGQAPWLMTAVRGQISIAEASRLMPLPRLPIAGAGYLLPEVEGRAVFGATAQPGDSDPLARTADHAHNLAQWAMLTGRTPDMAPASLQGRVGWRWTCSDRLPLIGPVPDTVAAAGARLDQPRFVPRIPGAYVFSGLASRGITWSALGAQVLASAMTGAPSPLEASLLDAVDPARFLSRESRRPRRG
ncbi:tRNA 5-methylaminomethyl-2-thiouridine biosynthesis bifunctional protein MnmC [Burkholderiaceae bacterium]|nr:tRNA 5-methylaminomethyl-2-thiouridine biosynthesis bifunctional protein MnmC [Burkholderiaceae bacterium]